MLIQECIRWKFKVQGCHVFPGMSNKLDRGIIAATNTACNCIAGKKYIVHSRNHDLYLTCTMQRVELQLTACIKLVNTSEESAFNDTLKWRYIDMVELVTNTCCQSS